MNDKKCLIIAEAGVNHNGNLDIALKLCDAAENAGADVIKFQTWKTEKIITKSVKQADYQIKNTGSNQSQYDLLKSLELEYDQFRKIKKHCDDIGIMFASTADENESLDFLIDLGEPFIKIGSGEICNIPFLRYVGSKGLPVLLSTGMSYLADVERSIRAIKEGGSTDITLLHCTTSYPCPYESINLNAMDTLRSAFGYKVGFSDHSIGIEVAIAAVAKGAKILEKHFTLDRTMEGPDHIASIEPQEFRQMVSEIRHIELALGTGEKKPDICEKDISNVIRKRIVARREINVGEQFSEDNICVKRSESGIPCELWDYCMGVKANRKYDIDEGIIL